MTLWRLYLCETLLERLAEDLEDMALELGQLIQEQDPVVRQRHLPRHGQLAAADQPHIRDGVVRGPERARGDEGGAPTGEAGDAMDAGGLQGFCQAHRRQDGGEAPSQPRPARPLGAQKQEMIVRTRTTA